MDFVDSVNGDSGSFGCWILRFVCRFGRFGYFGRLPVIRVRTDRRYFLCLEVTSEALRVLSEIPPLLLTGNANEIERISVASAIYDSIESRLAAHYVDQEIKKYALGASASHLSTLRENFHSKQVNRMLSLILQQLNNETTRIAPIKAINVIIVCKLSSINREGLMSENIYESLGAT